MNNYRARMYDTDLKRFYSVDPLHQFATPYRYVGNNPVNFTDPTGMFTMLLLVEIWENALQQVFILFL